MAKPKKEFSAYTQALILALYALGKTDAQVAKILGMGRTTLIDALRYNGITDTIKKAYKGQADDKVEASLYMNATSGDTTACIFWLCNRRPERWKSLKHNIVSGDADGPPVQIIFKEVKSLNGRGNKNGRKS